EANLIVRQQGARPARLAGGQAVQAQPAVGALVVAAVVAHDRGHHGISPRRWRTSFTSVLGTSSATLRMARRFCSSVSGCTRNFWRRGRPSSCRAEKASGVLRAAVLTA